MGLIPYVELALVGPVAVFQAGLPLVEVVQGPTAHPDLALESLGLYLDSLGYDQPETERRLSRIPLRQ
jgi:hypothetical protein